MFKLSETKKRKDEELDPIRATRLLSRLKQYISELAHHSIGEISADHLDSVREDDDCYERKGATKATMLSALVPALQGEDTPRFLVEFGDSPISVKASEVEELAAVCTPSGFGDLETATTKVDPKVRKSLESTDHPLIAKTLEAHAEQIRKMASKVFCVAEKDVVIVPKKLLLYRKGGKFKKHVDTPPERAQHLGTAVVELTTPEIGAWGTGGRFFIGSTRMSGGVAVFAPDVPHERGVVEKGFRVAVTFELFSQGTTPPPTEDDTKFITALRAEPAPFGLVLENPYSLTQAIYGETDLRAVRLLEAAGIKYVRIPIVIDYGYERYGGDEAEETTSVCDIKGFPKSPEWADCLTFYPLDSSFIELSREFDEGAEHTGNEARACTLDMRYFATALLCGPPPDEEEAEEVAGESEERKRKGDDAESEAKKARTEAAPAAAAPAE